MDTLALKGRGGVTLTLFAPQSGRGRLEAHALMASAPTSRPRIFQTDNKRKYRVPALPERGFFVAHIVLVEVA